MIPTGAFSISASGPRHPQGSLGCGCSKLLGAGRTVRPCEGVRLLCYGLYFKAPIEQTAESLSESSRLTPARIVNVAKFKCGMYDQHHPTFHAALNSTSESRLPDHDPFIL